MRTNCFASPMATRRSRSSPASPASTRSRRGPASRQPAARSGRPCAISLPPRAGRAVPTRLRPGGGLAGSFLYPGKPLGAARPARCPHGERRRRHRAGRSPGMKETCRIEGDPEWATAVGPPAPCRRKRADPPGPPLPPPDDRPSPAGPCPWGSGRRIRVEGLGEPGTIEAPGSAAAATDRGRRRSVEIGQGLIGPSGSRPEPGSRAS